MIEEESNIVSGMDPSSEILKLANAESLTYVAWCQEQIAQNFFQPQLPPTPWAGRPDIISACAAEFKLQDLIFVGTIVDQAVFGMCGRAKGDTSNYEKQAMLCRLRAIYQLVLKALKGGRRETTFKFEEVPEAELPPQLRNTGQKQLRKQEMKEKVYHGVDMTAIVQLRGIEDQMAKLMGLYGDGSQDAVNVCQMLLDTLDKGAKLNQEKESEDAPASMALKAKQMKLAGPKTAQQQAIIKSIMSPDVDSPPTKHKSTPIEAELIDPDDEAEESG